MEAVVLRPLKYGLLHWSIPKAPRTIKVFTQIRARHFAEQLGMEYVA